MPRRTSCCTVCRTTSSVVNVNAADTATMESRNLVRNRIPPMVKPRRVTGYRLQKGRSSDLAPLRHKLVTRTVYRAEVQRIRGIFLQFLPQSQNVIIHRPRARIILVSPNVVQ